jgi:hypothetical protein
MSATWVRTGSKKVVGYSLVVSTDQQASILFCDMQYQINVVLKSSKFSQKRGLIEFAACVYDLAYLEYVSNAFPLVTELTVRQVPYGATSVQ